MRLLFFTSLVSLTAFAASGGATEEQNVWPVKVEQTVSAGGKTQLSWTGAGPFLFSQPLTPEIATDPVRARGFRPLYVETKDAQGEVQEAYTLYPLLTYRRSTGGYRWSVFELINHYSFNDTPGAPAQQGFDIWPFYFSRDTGRPESSYHAVLPLYGTVKNRFGQDRLNWVLFPLYARWERNHVVTTTAPWPFIKILQGKGNHGFEVWPLFGYRAKENAYREQFYLWPLIYRDESQLWEKQPDVKQGFLPFYASIKTADTRAEQFLLFFGYFDRTAPKRYHETDYLWPIWIQGRGDDRYINRWGPFYTHSIVKGAEKTWLMWPLWRQETWVEGPLRHTRRQLLYFLYHDTEQRSATNPNVPAAHRTHLWPLFSFWDNGAGKRQIQALSPFDVFFPQNEPVRLTYTPFFAVYRYSRDGDDRMRQSFLWNFVTYRRDAGDREFHVGPLFSSEARAGSKRYAFGNGVLAFARSDAGRWKLSFFDFKRREAPRAESAPAP